MSMQACMSRDSGHLAKDEVVAPLTFCWSQTLGLLWILPRSKRISTCVVCGRHKAGEMASSWVETGGCEGPPVFLISYHNLMVQALACQLPSTYVLQLTVS